jgi:hypothetical protein
MKYVLIIFGIAILLRIDFILDLFDRANRKMENREPVVEVSESKSDRTVVSIDQDQMLNTSPKEAFFTFLDAFHSAPDAEIRIRAMSWLKEHPKLFNQILDKDLESKIFKWRDHLNNNNTEVVNFILDLMAVLPGENQEILKNFFALWMDINMEHFIISYSRTKDTNCSIATTFGDPIPEEEKMNDYYQRIDSLKIILQKEKIEPIHRALAANCVLQLETLTQKLAPQEPSVEPPPSETVSPDPALAPNVISSPSPQEATGSNP